MRSSKVPPDILAAPAPVQLAWYEERLLEHDTLRRVYQEVRRALRPPVVKPLVMVLGPTGVGKSRLVRKLCEQVLKEARAEMVADPGYLPVEGIQLAAPETGNFDWKACYVKALQALQEPLIQYKRDPLQREVTRADPMRLWRESFCTAVRYRRTQFFYFDEAQHLLKVTGRRYTDQMDAVKSLSQDATIPLLFVGTYELLQLIDRSDQLSRRTRLIHFPRYDARINAEKEEFLTFLLTLRTYLPVDNPPDLSQHWQFLYAQSLGALGVLYDWTIDALKLSFEEGKPFGVHHLRATARRQSEVKEAYRVITNGEKKLADSPANREFYALLGLLDDNALAADNEPPAVDQSAKQPSKTAKSGPDAKKGAQRKRRPGGRNPTSDPVPPVIGDTPLGGLADV